MSRLPEDLAAPVLVVLHIPPYIASKLAEILSKAGPLPAVYGQDGAKIKSGVIYVASPDYYMILRDIKQDVLPGLCWGIRRANGPCSLRPFLRQPKILSGHPRSGSISIFSS